MKPTFGTCAGAILLANEVENPSKPDSARSTSPSAATPTAARWTVPSARGKLHDPLEMVFIRAPKIERFGKGVEVIATEGKDPVVVRKGKTMAATFHPELSQDPRVHQAFLDLVINGHSPS